MKERLPPIIIAGSGRSGTTWILDAIAESARLRPVYEPLHPFAVPEAAPFANRYLRENDAYPELKHFMDKIFAGKSKSIWINYRVRADRMSLAPRRLCSLDDVRVFYRTIRRFAVNYVKYRDAMRRERMIVKFIRANLMLPWLAKNYQPQILFVMRHPCAVIASKLRASEESWQFSGRFQQDLIRRYLQDAALNRDYLYRYRDLLSPVMEPIVGHAILWCIENALAMKDAQKLNCTIVYYEDLVSKGIDEWRRVFNELGLGALPDADLVSRPSEEAGLQHKNGFFDAGSGIGWRKAFDEKQLCEIEKVLEAFEIDTYSVHDPMPRRPRARID